jgi:hypothetical protein
MKEDAKEVVGWLGGCGCAIVFFLGCGGLLVGFIYGVVRAVKLALR